MAVSYRDVQATIRNAKAAFAEHGESSEYDVALEKVCESVQNYCEDTKPAKTKVTKEKLPTKKELAELAPAVERVIKSKGNVPFDWKLSARIPSKLFSKTDRRVTPTYRLVCEVFANPTIDNVTKLVSDMCDNTTLYKVSDNMKENVIATRDALLGKEPTKPADVEVETVPTFETIDVDGMETIDAVNACKAGKTFTYPAEHEDDVTIAVRKSGRTWYVNVDGVDVFSSTKPTLVTERIDSYYETENADIEPETDETAEPVEETIEPTNILEETMSQDELRIAKMTKAQLKAMCRKNGLPTNGNKGVLIARLQDAS